MNFPFDGMPTTSGLERAELSASKAESIFGGIKDRQQNFSIDGIVTFWGMGSSENVSAGVFLKEMSKLNVDYGFFLTSPILL